MYKIRRKRKLSKWQVIWRIIIIKSLLFNVAFIVHHMMEYTASLGVVRRTGFILMLKGWLSNWDMQWMVDIVTSIFK